jgi:hypothetical protein
MQRGKHKVTRERGLDGDRGRLQVSNLTQHDDIRRLTQHGSEGGGEGHAHILLHHHLVDARQLVFHGIFHRDDLAV